MKRTFLKVALVLLGGHLLFGVLLLIVDAVHGVNDQDFSFALWLAFYYLNYSGVLLLRWIGPGLSPGLLILAALPQWLAISAIITAAIRIFKSTRNNPRITNN